MNRSILKACRSLPALVVLLALAQTLPAQQRWTEALLKLASHTSAKQLFNESLDASANAPAASRHFPWTLWASTRFFTSVSFTFPTA